MQTHNEHFKKFIDNLDDEIFYNAHRDDIKANIIASWNTEEAQLALQNTLSKKLQKRSKRAKNPYVLYCQDYRETVKQDLPSDHKNAHVMSELGKRWKLLTSSTDSKDVELLARYTKQANEEREMLKKNPTKQVEDVQKTTKKNKKQVNDKRRAKNPYVLYCQDHREIVKENLPDGYKSPDVMSELGKRWKILVQSTEPSDIALVNKYKQMSADEKALLSDNLQASRMKNYTEENSTCQHCHKYGEGAYDNIGFFYCDDCWIIYHGCGDESVKQTHETKHANVNEQNKKESKNQHKADSLVKDLFGSDSEDDI